MSAMLEVKDLSVAYGKILAVKDVSFTVNQGEIVTLIGSNGALHFTLSGPSSSSEAGKCHI